MKLSDFKVLTFDCYGTLIDWETGMFQALSPLLGGMRVTARRATAVGVEPNGKYRTVRRRVPLSLSACFEACEGV